ncbi:MAG: endonuclease III domain-containing protein [Nitrospinota bacterium]|nr:endonuclease III domain-containing protein [Nitrospinota bacterium]
MKNKILAVYNSLFAAFGEQHWWPSDSPLETCIGAILTQNTAWTNVEKAIDNLKREGLIDLKGLMDIEEERLAQLIRPSGYFNIKAKRLKSFISFISDNYGGSLETFFAEKDNIREILLSVKGVGPETADSILLYAGNIPTFVIDTYTKRIFVRLGIAKEDISYDALQKVFIESLPQEAQLYNEYHALIVRLAKEHCRKKPICEGCPLSSICHYPA